MNWIKEHPLESVVILLLVIRAVAALIRKTVNPKEGSRLDGILDLVEGALVCSNSCGSFRLRDGVTGAGANDPTFARSGIIEKNRCRLSFSR